MHLNRILVCLLSSLALVHGQDVITRCRDVGFNAFADELEQHPELVARIESRRDTVVWAVPDKAVSAFLGNNTSIRKRQVSASEMGGQTTHGRPTPYRKRQQLASSNAETLFAYLEDPEFVNLGPNQPGRLVKSYVGPNTPSEANYQVASGLGSVVSQTNGPFKFDRGVIFGVESFFTLPGTFSDSIRSVGRATQFYDAVVRAGLRDFFERTPACSIFAPIDSKRRWAGIDPKKHIICGFIGFTPELLPGITYTSAAGTPIKITIGDNGVKLVNGLRIVTGDISMKNGPLHLIEKPFDNNSA